MPYGYMEKVQRLSGSAEYPASLWQPTYVGDGYITIWEVEVGCFYSVNKNICDIVFSLGKPKAVQDCTGYHLASDTYY